MSVSFDGRKKAAFIADFLRQDLVSTFAFDHEEAADENRCLTIYRQSLSTKLAAEVERLLERHGRPTKLSAGDIASKVLHSYDDEGEAHLGAIRASEISVERTLAHVLSLELGLPDRTAVSLARRTTIALLNHRCGPTPQEMPSQQREQVPTAGAERIEPAPRFVPKKLVITSTDLPTGRRLVCCGCGVDAGPELKRKISGETFGSAPEDFVELMTDFIDKAKAESARVPLQSMCFECGDALVATGDEYSQSEPQEDAVVRDHARASREVIGTVKTLFDQSFVDGELPGGTVLDRVKATPKELDGGWVAVRWKDKTRFLKYTSVELLDLPESDRTETDS